MSTLFLLVASLVATGCGVVALCLVRAKSNGEAEGFALTGAIALFGGIVGLLLSVASAYGTSLGDYFNAHLPWWLVAVLRGTVLGVLIYVGWHAWHLARAAYLWACRRPDEDETIGFALRRHLWTVAPLALFFIAITALDRLPAARTGLYYGLQWLVVLIALSALPMYRTWVLPWILYYRGKELDPLEHGGEIHQWIEEVRKAHDVPKFHLRVQEGKMVNALALGGLHRYFIVLGRGLLNHLPREHVKAVLAHEIGHVMNRDSTRRATPLILFSTCLHLLYINHVVLPMDSFWTGMLCVGIGAPFFWIILPGIFQRRWEYGADRKAVELMGDAEVVAQSLIRLYDASNIHIDAPGWPHPSLRARLQAIRRLAGKGADTNADA